MRSVWPLRLLGAPAPTRVGLSPTAYARSREIRAMLVRDRRLLAASEWFRVNIYAKGRAYRL